MTNIICGALFAIRTNQLGGIAIQTAKDTAEFTADLMLPYINGYESVYLKIDNFCGAVSIRISASKGLSLSVIFQGRKP